MQKPYPGAPGLKARLGAAIQASFPALWRGLTACRDLLAGQYAQTAAEHRSALHQIEAKHQAALTQIQGLEQTLAALKETLAGQRRFEQVVTFMDWIDQAPMPAGPLVSVVLPTRDRREFLERAIASVTAQSYSNWELVIVDDGSVDSTPDFLAQIADPRIVRRHSGGRGVCAARNVALDHMTGGLVAYLDDDNIMHRDWLKSLVWGFAQFPDKDVAYGAVIIDDYEHIDPQKKGDLPRLFFFPYNHSGVAIDNIADQGCIAHRAGLTEARFDESLQEMGDWDLFLRLTRETPPFALPAIACYYMTDAPNRLSYGPTHEADRDKVREKNRR